MPEGLRVAGFPRIASLPRVGKATIQEYRSPHNIKANTRICRKRITTDKAFSSRGRQRGGGFAAKKEANPALLRSAAPSKGRGSRRHSLLPMEGGAPKGRRLDGESGMKKSGGDRLKQAIYESTRAPLARSPFPNGEGYDTRIPLSP